MEIFTLENKQNSWTFIISIFVIIGSIFFLAGYLSKGYEESHENDLLNFQNQELRTLIEHQIVGTFSVDSIPEYKNAITVKSKVDVALQAFKASYENSNRVVDQGIHTLTEGDRTIGFFAARKVGNNATEVHLRIL